MEIEVNGTRLSFGVEGAAPVPGRGRCGSARRLVLDHGGPGTYDHSDLKPDFARLFGACQVIYLDLRGHGRSIGVRAAAWSFEDARTTSARSATRSGQAGQSSSGTRWRTGRAALRRAAWPLGALGGDPPLCSAAARWRPLRCGLARAFAKPRRHLERDFHTRPLDACPYTVAPADALTTKVREGGRVNVHTSVATGVNARARTGSPVPLGAEPFRQGREHGHGRFWPLLEYGV
jgi:hypothetical protein